MYKTFLKQFKLSDSFLEPYKSEQPKWGPLGEFVYLRTYSRIVEGENRNEAWWETVRRVVEGAFQIQKEYVKSIKLPWNDNKAMKSAKIMYDKMFNFKFLPPGRGLWLMGTDYVRTRGSMALNNCAFVSTNDIETRGSFPFTWSMDGLMNGVGCIAKGTKIMTVDGPKNIEDLEHRPFIALVNGKPYYSRTGSWKTGTKPTLKLKTKEGYEVIATDNHKFLTTNGWKELGEIQKGDKVTIHNHSNKFPNQDIYATVDTIEQDLCMDVYDINVDEISAFDANGFYVHNCGFDTKGTNRIKIKQPKERTNETFVIPDSREGWVESLKILLDGFFSGTVIPEFDYTLIRKAGEPIKGFGGVSSGSEPLKQLHNRVNDLLTKRIGEKIKSTDIVDIMNMIGCCVIAGNVRRCIPEGAMVHMIGKNRSFKCPIESVNIGDIVLTSDNQECKVTNKFIQGKQQLAKITTEHGIFECTENHRMAVEFKADDMLEGTGQDENGYPIYKWKQTKYLTTDDSLIFLENEFTENQKEISSKVLSVEFNVRETETYEVEKEHSFFCNGYLTHNSAEIALGEWNDKDFVTMKDYNLHPEEVMSHRWSSNNSVFAEVGKTDYHSIADSIVLNGEPGLVWLENMRKYGRLKDGLNDTDKQVSGTNPCGEIQLNSYELCNLVETFPSLHDSFEDYKHTLKYAYLYSKTVSLLPTHSEVTNAVLMKNRRIGCSQSGIIDAFNKHGRHEMLRWCDEGYVYLRELDKIYSDWLCIPKSIKITTTKPSGSVSLLAGVSAGIHYPHSEYYIRRVRIDSKSPLVPIMKKAGYHIEYNMYGKTDEEKQSTSVISFPVKETNFSKKKSDVSIWEQVKNCVDYQTFWSDNCVSITATFNKNEVNQIPSVLEAYDRSLKSISFLPLSEHGYLQAPYEEITKEIYENMVSTITKPDFSSLCTDPEGSKYCDGDRCDFIPKQNEIP